MLTDHKITAEAVAEKGIVSAPDKLSGTAAENKALFDRLVREVVAEKINDLIDEIVTELAGKMPAPTAEGVVGQYLRIGENGVEWGIPAGSGDMIAAIYDKDGDGSVDRADVAGATEGNAATATKLQTPRSFTIKDAEGVNTGRAASFDGGEDAVIRLPAVIKASVTGAVEGNAATATKLQTARTIGIKDSSGSNIGAAQSFDGSGNVVLPLPASIKANITGNVTGNASGSSGSCTGNAATATKLKTARTLTIQDNSGVYSGGAVSFDGSGNIIIKLPASIKLTKLIAGSGLAGTSYPSSPVEGQLFFLEG